MRRWRGGQAIWILLAASAGYLIGNWNTAPIAGRPQPTTSTVALRFQEDFAQGAAAQPAVPSIAPQPVLGSAHLPLFEPQPIMPNVGGFVQPAAAQPTAATQPSSIEAELTSAPAALPPPDKPTEAVKPHLAAPRPASRPDPFNDAQLARIKRRLHLTADQEYMWPAVAAALRNIGREQKLKARLRIDPNSAAVADLKSAAMPLLMSFSDAQKDEVRRLARNMGLEQLASEF